MAMCYHYCLIFSLLWFILLHRWICNFALQKESSSDILFILQMPSSTQNDNGWLCVWSLDTAAPLRWKAVRSWRTISAMKPHRLCSRIWGLQLHTRHFSSSSTWGHWLSTFFPQIYGFFGLPTRQVTHPVQLYALIAWCFHYRKWEFETFFIHRFSHATSPLANLYCNCSYYWAFGAFIAYFVNHPLYTPVSKAQSVCMEAKFCNKC
jgi:hypothetical protein